MQASTTTSKPLPLLDLSRQYAAIRGEVLAAIERVCGSQQFVLGPEAEALEAEIAAFTGAGAAVACASGTDALWLALVAAGVQPGDRVITTPFSFFASASSIVRAGAQPVFVDVDPTTLNIDPVKVRTALEQTTGSSTSQNRLRSSRSRSARNERAKDDAFAGHGGSRGEIAAILPVHL